MRESLDSRQEDLSTEDLFLRYKESGDPYIRHLIITKNLSLVRPVLKKFFCKGESREDLLQAGYVGLIKAVDHYDLGKNVKFSTFASYWIEGEIRHYIRDRLEITRRPRWLQDLIKKVDNFIERFIQEKGRIPDVREISGSLNISEEGIDEIVRIKNCWSFGAIEEPISCEIEVNKIKSIRAENFRLPIEDKIAILQAIERLKMLERKVVYLFFYYDLTQMQISKKLGISQKKVSRLLQRAIENIKGCFLR